MLLEHGATRTNLALDLATAWMFDSNEPEALGQVATVGVPIDCIEDMEVIYNDIPIDKISFALLFNKGSKKLINVFIPISKIDRSEFFSKSLTMFDIFPIIMSIILSTLSFT